MEGPARLAATFLSVLNFIYLFIYFIYEFYQLRMELKQSQCSVTTTTTTLLLYYYYYYIFQIFSSNLSNPSSRGGIVSDLCRSKSLGTSHSTQGRDDSSSTEGVLHGRETRVSRDRDQLIAIQSPTPSFLLPVSVCVPAQPSPAQPNPAQYSPADNSTVLWTRFQPCGQSYSPVDKVLAQCHCQ